eukprot:8873355-Lingulodinium_polyedra.AAC.1
MTFSAGISGRCCLASCSGELSSSGTLGSRVPRGGPCGGLGSGPSGGLSASIPTMSTPGSRTALRCEFFF